MIREWIQTKHDEHLCFDCGRYFPKSVLITIDSPFEEIRGRYCTVCAQKAFKRNHEMEQFLFTMSAHCESCGEEYPMSHLFHDSIYSDSHLCWRCYDREHQETQ